MKAVLEPEVILIPVLSIVNTHTHTHTRESLVKEESAVGCRRIQNTKMSVKATTLALTLPNHDCLTSECLS